MGLIETVKVRIKEVLKQKGWSIYELAEKAELTEACIRNWYTKRNYTPSLEAVEKICRAFEISVAELVCSDDEKLVPLNGDGQKFMQNWTLLDKKQRTLLMMQMDAFLNP